MPGQLLLHDAHLSAGARIAAPCGVLLPVSYGDPAGEYHAVRTAVGVIDRSWVGLVEASGADRAAFLNGMLTNDIKSLAPGQGCGAAFLDAHGKVQSLLAVLADPEQALLLVRGGTAARLVELLDRFLFSERVSLRDASNESVLLLLAGPGTAALVRELAGVSLPTAAWHHVPGRVGEVAVRLIGGDGETGEPEAWLCAPSADGPRLWDQVCAAGARPVGLSALDVLRVEAGTVWYGHDADESTLLPELPLGSLVSSTKGCYIGQEVVVRIRDRGHANRAVTGLAFDGDEVPQPGAPVVVEGRAIGRVTSAVRSFGLGRPIALGMIRREHARPGTVVTVDAGGHAIPGQVTGLPFVRPT
jgi:folate-binding protein YgfZ